MILPAVLYGVELRLTFKNSTDNKGVSHNNYRLSNKVMEKNWGGGM
jgi:hypothetical protein